MSRVLLGCGGGETGVTRNDLDDGHVGATSRAVRTPANKNPVLDFIADQPVAEGAYLEVPVSATDDAGGLTFKAEGLPVGASFSNSLKKFWWTPGYDQAGVYSVKIVVTDVGALTDSQTFHITVTNTNRAPVVSPIDGKTVAAGDPLAFVVAGSDPDGTPLSFDVFGSPDGALFDEATRMFAWTPGCDAVGEHSVVFVASDGELAAALVVSIRVTGGVVVVTPSPLQLGAVRVGETSPGVAATIANHGDAAFSITRVASNLSVFRLASAPEWPVLLAPGETAPLTVTFAPTAPLLYAGRLEVTTDATQCGSAEAPLEGQGQSAILGVTPAAGLEFGVVRVGAAETPKLPMVLTNAGAAAFAVVSLQVDDTASFSVQPDDAPWDDLAPVLLAPGESLALTASAHPATVGLVTTALVIGTDIPSAPTVSVGLAVVGIAPGVTPSASKLDFGAVDVEGPAGQRTLVLVNSGSDALTILDARVEGAGAARYDVAWDGVPRVVPVATSADILVSYQPTVEAAEEELARLVIDCDAVDAAKVEIPLSGHGIDRHLAVSPVMVTFAPTRRNAAFGPKEELRVRNTGSARLLFGGAGGVGALVIAGAGAAAFHVAGELPTSLAADEEAAVAIEFRPTTLGSIAAFATLTSDDDAPSVARIELAGTGIGAGLVVTPATLDLGDVAVGLSRRGHLSVANPGETAHTVDLGCVAATSLGNCDPQVAFRVVGPLRATALSPGESIDVEVEFSPLEDGEWRAAILMFVTDDPAPELAVPVSGHGVVDVTLTGGRGCAAGPRGAKGTSPSWIGLLAVVMLGVCRRNGQRVAAVALLALVGAGAGGALAEPATFDVSTFHPLPGESGTLITVEQPQVSQKAWALGLVLDQATKPLRVGWTGGPGDEFPVAERISLVVVGRARIAGRLELGCSLPSFLSRGETSAGALGLPAASGGAIGDVALSTKVRLGRLGPVAFAVAALATLPTGDEAEYAGAAGWTGGGLLVMGAGDDRARLAVNLGYLVRGVPVVLENNRQGDAYTFGVGGAWRVVRGLEAIGEVFGTARAPVATGGPAPVEAIGALRYGTRGGLAISAGAGTAIVAGIGGPSVRGFVGLGWSPGRAERSRPSRGAAGARPVSVPLPSADEDEVGEVEDTECFEGRCPGDDRTDVRVNADTDSDGIPDAVDRCPTEPEDKDGFRDGDGCDDPDNDNDGVPDALDQCAVEPETINGNEDLDGCPDAGEPQVRVAPGSLELTVPIVFAAGSATMKPASLKLLAQVAATLRAHLEVGVLTVYATTRDGAVARRRASAVVKALVERGVDEARLVGEGESGAPDGVELRFRPSTLRRP